MINFEADGATSKIVDGAPAVKSRLTEIEVGKRKSKSTEHWLVYQVSQLKERRKKLHARVLRKSIAVDVLHVQPEMLRLLGSRCSTLMECSK